MSRLRDDRGSSTLEFALVSPVLAVVGALGVQVALWAHAQNVAQAAAQQGARALAAADGAAVDGQQRTRDYQTILGPRMLQNVDVHTERTAASAEVQVRGTVVSLLPGLTFHVSERARQQREQFQPDLP